MVRCLLPHGAGRFMHLVVLYGYQGADTDAEQLALTEQLFDAALGELGVLLPWNSPVCLLETSTWSPPKSLAWQKGFRLGSGLILRLLELWLLGCSLLPLVSVIGVLVVVTEGTLWWVAPLLLIVRLGGHKVKKARGNAADALDAANVILYRDSSSAPLLETRRRFKAVMDVLGAMIQYGLSCSGRLSSLLNGTGFLLVDPFTLLLSVISMLLRVWASVIFIGLFLVFIIVSMTSFMRSLFITRTRLPGWRNWLREDPVVHPYKWLRPDLVPPARFLQCKPHRTSGGSVGAC